MMSMLVIAHPFWQSAAAVLLVTIASALALQAAVQRFVPAGLRQDHNELAAAIFSVIGVTYAVLLAFVAMTAWEQHSAAEALERHEANLIGNLYSASRGVADPVGGAMRADLSAYLTNILEVDWPSQIAGRQTPALDPILDRLNCTVLGMTITDAAGSNTQRFLVDALAEVATDRRNRRLAVHGTVPDLVWFVLLAGGALTVGFSFLLGGPKKSFHSLMTTVLVASGVLVLLLVLGLNSPFQGGVTLSPEPYEGVLSEIQLSHRAGAATIP